MAYGNALKEKFLPECNGSFKDLENEAREKYIEAVNIFLKLSDIHGYNFVMLEQMNLFARKRIWERWERDKKVGPKRIAVFHSLESPESHKYLHGIRYLIYKADYEIWEYHYGRVPPFDVDEDFIKDRLKEASGVVFLASKAYDEKTKDLVKLELDKTITLKGKNDPLGILIID